MNPPKAIELAIAAMIRSHANIGAKTLVRPWQSLNVEGAFDPKDDRTFPCVDVRFGSPRHNEDQTTLVCSGEILSMVYAEDDRTFPFVDVRFGSPRHNEDQTTLVCSGEILSMVYAEDDRNHQAISGIYDEVHDVVLGIFRDFMGRIPAGEFGAGFYSEFIDLVAQEDGGKIRIGGITMEEGMPPSDDGNALGIGVGMGIHFSYA
jgi:hypothetical protein